MCGPLTGPVEQEGGARTPLHSSNRRCTFPTLALPEDVVSGMHRSRSGQARHFHQTRLPEKIERPGSFRRPDWSLTGLLQMPDEALADEPVDLPVNVPAVPCLSFAQPVSFPAGTIFVLNEGPAQFVIRCNRPSRLYLQIRKKDQADAGSLD